MSVLCDWEIRALCEAGMIEGYSDDLINPASLDVRLGSYLMIEVADTKDFVNVDISHKTEKNPYRLMPGEFCLAETKEIFNMQDSISAQFVLKSSRLYMSAFNLPLRKSGIWMKQCIEYMNQTCRSSMQMTNLSIAQTARS